MVIASLMTGVQHKTAFPGQNYKNKGNLGTMERMSI